MKKITITIVLVLLMSALVVSSVSATPQDPNPNLNNKNCLGMKLMSGFATQGIMGYTTWLAAHNNWTPGVAWDIFQAKVGYPCFVESTPPFYP